MGTVDNTYLVSGSFGHTPSYSPIFSRWLIDFDSTLALLDEALLSALNAKFDTDYQPGDNVSWDWWFNELPTDQFHYVWGDEVFNNEAFTLKLKPLAHAIDAVSALMRRGDKCFVVSDRQSYMQMWLQQWLDQQGLYIPVIVSGSNTYTKKEVAELLRLDRVIEDAPHHAETFRHVDCIKKLYLMDTPYNQHVESDEKVIRLYNHWQEFMQLEHLTPKYDRWSTSINGIITLNTNDPWYADSHGYVVGKYQHGSYNEFEKKVRALKKS